MTARYEPIWEIFRIIDGCREREPFRVARGATVPITQDEVDALGVPVIYRSYENMMLYREMRPRGDGR